MNLDKMLGNEEIAMGATIITMGSILGLLGYASIVSYFSNKKNKKDGNGYKEENRGLDQQYLSKK